MVMPNLRRFIRKRTKFFTRLRRRGGTDSVSLRLNKAFAAAFFGYLNHALYHWRKSQTKRIGGKEPIERMSIKIKQVSIEDDLQLNWRIKQKYRRTSA